MFLKSKIYRSSVYKSLAYRIKRNLVLNNPYKEIERCYAKAYPGKKINLEVPQNFIEKIYWMEWNTDTTLWTKCADKYRVREFLQEKGLSHISPLLLAKWDKPEDIDFTGLPNEFIIKTNDGCGTNYIVHNKNNEDLFKIKKLFSKFLKFRQGYSNAQYHYLEIEPCIIAEELLHQSEELNRLSPNSLVDYKIYCINGLPECINVIYNRTSSSVQECLYDINWKKLKGKFVTSSHFTIKDDIEFPKPQCLREMLQMAEILSEPFPEVRVDFYVINNKPVFGELTFSSGYGDFTEDYMNYLGDKMDLSCTQKVCMADKIKKIKEIGY